MKHLFQSVAFAFAITVLTFACNEQEAEKKVTFEELKTKYNLKIAENQKDFKTDPSLTFATAAEADKFLNAIQNSPEKSLHFESIVTPLEKDNNSIIITASGVLTGMARLSQDPGSEKNTNSEMIKGPTFGFTTFYVSLDWNTNYSNPTATTTTATILNAVTFTQTTSSSNAAYYNSSTGVFNINIDGMVNRNLFVEGVGTVQSTPGHVSGTYDPKTGRSSITVSYK